MKGAFDFKYFFMDLGRSIYFIGDALFMRVKKVDLNGNKYKGKIQGGALICANHVDFLDPFVIGCSFLTRRVHFLAAEAVMRNWLLTTLLGGMGCIKIDRNISDIEAIRKSVNVLKNGKLLAMFPEGGIHRDGEVDTVKSGAALIALQAKVPILPVYSEKRKHWYQRRLVVIGEAFDPKELCERKIPSLKEMENISLKIKDCLNDCQDTYEKETYK